MKKAILLATLLLVGCSNSGGVLQNTDRSDTDSSNAAISAASAAVEETSAAPPSTSGSDAASASTTPSPPSWQFSEENSPMDGDVLHAEHQFVFENAIVTADIFCDVQKQNLHITLTAVTGNADFSMPDPLQTTEVVTLLGTFEAPVGRIKFGNNNPEPISDFFQVTPSVNRIALKGFSLSQYLRLAGISAPDPVGMEQHFNPVGGLKEVLPMTFEVNDGTDTFDGVIDKSDEVLKVLDACNGSAPPIDAERQQLIAPASGSSS